MMDLIRCTPIMLLLIDHRDNDGWLSTDAISLTLSYTAHGDAHVPRRTVVREFMTNSSRLMWMELAGYVESRLEPGRSPQDTRKQYRIAPSMRQPIYQQLSQMGYRPLC